MYVEAQGNFIVGDVVDDERKGVAFKPRVGGGFVVRVCKCLVGCGDVAIKSFDVFEVWVVVGQDGVHVSLVLSVAHVMGGRVFSAVVMCVSSTSILFLSMAL